MGTRQPRAYSRGAGMGDAHKQTAHSLVYGSTRGSVHAETVRKVAGVSRRKFYKEDETVVFYDPTLHLRSQGVGRRRMKPEIMTTEYIAETIARDWKASGEALKEAVYHDGCVVWSMINALATSIDEDFLTMALASLSYKTGHIIALNGHTIGEESAE